LLTATQLPDAEPALKARALRALATLDQQATPPNPTAASAELLTALNLTPRGPEEHRACRRDRRVRRRPAAAERAYRRYLASLGTPQTLKPSQRWPRPAGRAPPADAEALLAPALAAHPSDPALTALLARVDLSSTTPPKSPSPSRCWKSSTQPIPQDANITRLLARVYLDTDHPDQADPLYAALISAQSQAGKNPDPTLLDDRAEALLRLHRPAAAETLLKQAVANPAAFPTRAALADAATHLAFAAAGIDDPRTTLQALALRATVLPPSPSTLFLEAMANDTLHRNARAIDLYRQFLTAVGTDYPDQAAQARQRLAALAPENKHAAPKR